MNGVELRNQPAEGASSCRQCSPAGSTSGGPPCGPSADETLIVLLAQPRGFCAGVVRASDGVERALIKYGTPVYVWHEIVHNKYVVENLKARGAIFVEDLGEVPSRAVTAFSAHSRQERRGKSRQPPTFRSHRYLSAGDEAFQPTQQLSRTGPAPDHPNRRCRPCGSGGNPGSSSRHCAARPEGRRGRRADPAGRCAGGLINQNTLSVDDTQAIIQALESRFRDIPRPNTCDICYATQNRQSAVRDLGKLVDFLLVVGLANSSNSNKLREIGRQVGIPSYLLAGGSDLNADWLKNARTVGITAGASAPEVLIDHVIETFRRIGPVGVSVLPGREENVELGLPAELAAV